MLENDIKQTCRFRQYTDRSFIQSFDSLQMIQYRRHAVFNLVHDLFDGGWKQLRNYTFIDNP